MGSHIIEIETHSGYKLFVPVQAKDGPQLQLAIGQIRKHASDKSRHQLVKGGGYYDTYEEARAAVNRPEGNAQYSSFLPKPLAGEAA